MSVTERAPTSPAILALRDDFDRLRGRLFMALESFHLAERHEEATKGIVRRLTYDMQAQIEAKIRRNDAR